MAKKKDKKTTPSRVGSQLQSVFDKPKAHTTPIKQETQQPPEITDALGSRGPGRPKKFDDNKKKTTVSFQLEQIVWLDRLCTDILSNTKNVIDRGDIIRACVEALHESGIDLSHVTSAEKIKEIILIRLTETKKA